MMYDLSRPIISSMPVYPGDPPVQVKHLSFPPWQISELHMGSHSGTHLDAPRHRFATGMGIDDITPDRLIGPGIVIDVGGYSANAELGPSVLTGYEVRPGMAVLFRTGWEVYWGSDDYAHHPYIGAALAEALVQREVRLVGIDAFSVDSTVAGGDAAHTVLLRNNILIVENLCHLANLELGVVYTVACFPLLIVGGDGAPARVLAWRATGVDPS
ncbi:MAG: cyclase [Chloroflexus sp.]|uniref:cyclase family protein n=1 Tax=Chloroflexus sp. TaxID=1904827 RepID=UPI0021DD47A8|nr:cyclase family protein [Chloroflexus sp.]GIV90574.1 MAG: cyclase [Chloroflexus sp.]